ncbi:hypothetical protein [Levilactobacillus brevis]|uniref:hypothetical protein n=1 Tax=Levilactobacillus brevis TaxID=1580 RepID=UPI003F4AE2EF
MNQSILNETSRVLKERYLSNKENFDKKAKILKKKNEEKFSQFMLEQATRLLTKKILENQHEQVHDENIEVEPYIDFNVSLETDETKNLSLRIEINEPFFAEEDFYSLLSNSDRPVFGSMHAPLFI